MVTVEKLLNYGEFFSWHSLLFSQGSGIQIPDYSKPKVLLTDDIQKAGSITAPDDGVLYIAMQSDAGHGGRYTYIYDKTGTPVMVNASDRSNSNTLSFFVKKDDTFTFTAGWVNQIVFYPFRKS